MKNLKSFPFERNRYFYGKLLSVEDFKTEQKYFNDKRRTINRFLFGSGVVCGLNVVEIDEETVSLERGIALDFAGREIVVDEPAVKRIADLEGYDPRQTPGQDHECYYLCLEYQENAAEPVHNVAGTAEQDGGEYNKYREGYRLFLSKDEPQQEVFSPFSYYEGTTEIYHRNGILIRQILPRYVQAGGRTVLRIEIENTGQQQSFSFEYTLNLSLFTWQGETSVQVHFDEKDHEKNKKYVLEIPLEAAADKEARAVALLDPDSFALHVGEKIYHMAECRKNQADVSGKPAGMRIAEAYFKGSMDVVENHKFQQAVYLAKINVIKIADICLIERMEALPFGQCVLNADIFAAELRQLSEEIQRLKEDNAAFLDLEAGGREASRQQETSCGEMLFDLDGVKPGETLYSDQIYHGLGPNPVTIVLGYEVEDGLSEDREMVFGDASVFQSGKEGFRAFMGAKLDVQEGAFLIGMRVQKIGRAQKVRVSWTALKNPAETLETQKKRLFIQPDNPNLRAGESIDFAAVTEGFEDERMKWSVKDAEGGTIDKNGKYTAPETPGVYRIGAVSTAYPQIEASTFVVVQDEEENWLR